MFVFLMKRFIPKYIAFVSESTKYTDVLKKKHNLFCHYT